MREFGLLCFLANQVNSVTSCLASDTIRENWTLACTTSTYSSLLSPVRPVVRTSAPRKCWKAKDLPKEMPQVRLAGSKNPPVLGIAGWMDSLSANPPDPYITPSHLYFFFRAHLRDFCSHLTPFAWMNFSKIISVFDKYKELIINNMNIHSETILV